MSPSEQSSGEPTFQNRARASSFGANAELYDETRPDYPVALVDQLMAPPPALVLDVGCGTGILGRELLARGAAVLGVEPDDKMAAVARRHGLDVELATFEDWDDAGRRFGLLVSGQAWHWVDPVLGAAKAAAVVSPGGRVVLAWNHAIMPADLRGVLDEVYARHTSANVSPTVPHRSSDWQRAGGSEAVFAAHGEFDGPAHATYPWDRQYSRAQWLRQLETHSDHALLDAGARRQLLDAVGEAIDQMGGSFTMHYDCRATTFARR
jgi:SAM-dependent methyltransferase